MIIINKNNEYVEGFAPTVYITFLIGACPKKVILFIIDIIKTRNKILVLKFYKIKNIFNLWLKIKIYE